MIMLPRRGKWKGENKSEFRVWSTGDNDCPLYLKLLVSRVLTQPLSSLPLWEWELICLQHRCRSPSWEAFPEGHTLGIEGWAHIQCSISQVQHSLTCLNLIRVSSAGLSFLSSPRCLLISEWMTRVPLEGTEHPSWLRTVLAGNLLSTGSCLFFYKDRSLDSESMLSSHKIWASWG